MTVTIIDYGSGNLHSAAKAFARAGEALGHRVIVTADAKALASASHIVLPGVGAFADCINGLQAVDGMIDALQQAALKRKIPFLGICVGMQMLFERGLEHGEHTGLGWLEGDVVPIAPEDPSLKIPHMGWNQLMLSHPDHPLFANLPADPHVYFVHSYHAHCRNRANILATCDYGTSITAVVGRDNILGTQFHPEKSGEIGLQLIENFLKM